MQLALLRRDVDGHETRLTDVEEDVETLRSRLDVLATRVGIYAALGAAAGGALISGIAGVVVFFVVQ